MQVIFDRCVIDRLAACGIDPVRDLKETNFQIAFTPDLAKEYEAGLAHSAPTHQEKDALQQILQNGDKTSFFGLGEGPWLGFDQGRWASTAQMQTVDSISNGPIRPTGIPKGRTDVYLVALADEDDVVIITANTNEAHWKNASSKRHIIQWERDLKPKIEAGATLAEAIKSIVS